MGDRLATIHQRFTQRDGQDSQRSRFTNGRPKITYRASDSVLLVDCAACYKYKYSMYRLAHYFATLPENSVLFQGDRACELISRPELRQTDRHADEAKTDATETAVTGHLRPLEVATPIAPPPFRPRLPCSYLAKSRPQRGYWLPTCDVVSTRQ